MEGAEREVLQPDSALFPGPDPASCPGLVRGLKQSEIRILGRTGLSFSN